MARIVITHSTYIDGLIPRLKLLATMEGIKTITPGVIKKTKGKSQGFRIRISVRIQNGFKIIARKGNMCQEVFITTNLKWQDIANKLEELE